MDGKIRLRTMVISAPQQRHSSFGRAVWAAGEVATLGLRVHAILIGDPESLSI